MPCGTLGAGGATASAAFTATPTSPLMGTVIPRAEVEQSCGHPCLDVHADDLQAHAASQTQTKWNTKWNVKYKLGGIAVCRAAFRRLTGSGVSSLMLARDGALQDHKSSLGGQELGLYIDARQWLEHYAAKHGDR